MAVPSDAHLLAFGRILHNYASVETGIQIALSGILEIGLAEASIAFQPYTASNLRNVAKSIAKERLQPILADQFSRIVSDWSHHNKIRDLIAHTRWTDGDRPGSIRARGVSIENGSAQWLGDDTNQASYTALELEKLAKKLHEINERAKRFLTESGLRRIVEAKLEAKTFERFDPSG